MMEFETFSLKADAVDAGGALTDAVTVPSASGLDVFWLVRLGADQFNKLCGEKVVQKILGDGVQIKCVSHMSFFRRPLNYVVGIKAYQTKSENVCCVANYLSRKAAGTPTSYPERFGNRETLTAFECWQLP